MDATATVSFRMDAKLKKKFESIIQMMGLNMTTAFTRNSRITDPELV